MRRLLLLATLLSGITLARADDVRAKELFYSAGVPQGEPEKGSNPGLKCSVELLGSSGKWSWVQPGRRFYSGDKIKIHVESNVEGRLAILQKQDDGTPDMLFPDARLQGGADLVRAGRETVIPLAFDETPGRVHLFFLLRMNLPAASREESTALLKQAEAASHSKGLRVDVDSSSSQPSVFTVRPGSDPNHKEGVAHEMFLEHLPRPKGR